MIIGQQGIYCFLLMIITSVNIYNLKHALGLLRSSPRNLIFNRSRNHIPSKQFYNILHKMKTRSSSSSASVSSSSASVAVPVLVLNDSKQSQSTNNPKNSTGNTRNSEIDNNTINVNPISRKRSHSQSKQQCTIDLHSIKSSIPTSTTGSSIDESTGIWNDKKVHNNDNNIPKNNVNDPENESLTFLKSFLYHTDIQYHYFSKQDAASIRLSLLTWYRQHRRKLPWRGDPSPWNGSTSNFASTILDNKTKTKKTIDYNKKQQQQSKQSSMKQFLTIDNTSSNKDEKYSKNLLIDQEKEPEQEQSSSTICYPITLYGVWVSEIMLQQTRVDAVIPYWVRWMTEFPTVYELANATCEQVNAAWAGLGFYRRARFLHDAAKIIVTQYNGIIPSSSIELQKLPGIGRYTACAIASIVSNEQVAVVDGNVCRVLSRLRCINQSIKVPVFKDQYGWILAQQIIDSYDDSNNNNNDDEGHCSGEVNQALMEIGATYCSPSGTGIDTNDPLHDYYWSTRLGYAISQTSTKIIFQLLDEHRRRHQQALDQVNVKSKCCCPVCHIDNDNSSISSIEQLITSLHESITINKNDIDTCRRLGHGMFPLAPLKTAKRVEVYSILALQAMTGTVNNEDIEQQDNNRWLLMKRPDNGLLAGQWEFPSVCLWSSATQLDDDDNNDDDDDNDTNKSKKKKKKQTKATSSSTDPVAPTFTLNERQNATKTLLRTLLSDDKSRRTTTTNDLNCDLYQSIISSMKQISSSSSKKDMVPLEHIFSHVRHTMYVDYCNLCDEKKAISSKALLLFINNPSQMKIDNREIRWMNESEMKLVGITAGVSKILTAINNTNTQIKKLN